MNNVAIVGMSARNSYFNSRNVGRIVQYLAERFPRTIFFSPDLPTEHTFRAKGYKRVKFKARRFCRALIKLANEQIAAQNHAEKVTTIIWEDTVEQHPEYLLQYKKIKVLFEASVEFRRDMLAATTAVLRGFTVSDNLLLDAAQYQLKELAYLLAAREIHDCSTITYTYHRPWPAYQKLIAGEYNSVSIVDTEGMYFLQLPVFEEVEDKDKEDSDSQDEIN